MAEVSKEQVIDYLSNMPVMELAGLVKDLEDKWGVSAAAPVAAAAAPAADAAPVEEQTEFDVVLASYGEKKIAVINIYPGFTLTETMARRLPPGVDTSRMERPETAAKAIAFLARDPLPHTGRIVVTRDFVADPGL